MKKLIIVAAQLNFLVGDIQGNTKRIIHAANTARDKHQADLIVFSELALTGYPPEDLLFRPGLYTRCQAAMAHICQEVTDITMVIGTPIMMGNEFFNAAVLIKNGTIRDTYYKQDLPNYTVFDEKRYFSPGNKACVFKLNDIHIGINICEDLWHYGPVQQAVDAGADIIISPNASPFDRNKARTREHMLQQRTTESHVPIVYLNQIGGQDELVFDGGSMVVNRQGERVQQAPYYQEQLMVIEVTKKTHVAVTPQTLPPRLHELENLYQALILGVKDYIHKNNFPGVIIGLSGGIDSALVTALAVDALGADNVRTVMMPSRYTAKMSIQDAQTMSDTLGIQQDTIDIEPMFQCFLKSLEKPFANTETDATEENIQARIRGILLMALSNKTGSLVLTTGNKSEMAVGYATLYGDMAGGFAALKDIPKTLVYKLARYRNNISAVIPERIIERPPTAELSAEQTDQDNLPPYSVLDEIINRYIDQDQAPETIYAAGLDKETVDFVIKLINRNEYKRRQAPVGIRTSQRAFGKDRRYPITSGYSKNI